jgi:hypothetical protein
MGPSQGGRERTVERVADGGTADDRVLAHLVRLGCDLAQPREVSHYLYLPARGGAAAIAAALEGDAGQARLEECEDGSWLVVAARVRPLDAEVVRETRRTLEALASEHGGVYDGWEVRRD